MLENVNLKVDWCGYKAASYACKRWHYSKCVPKYKQVWVGVWENEKFIGIVSFGRSSTPYLGTKYGLKTTECAELTRIALTSHISFVSEIMSKAIKLLKTQSKGIKLLVSLADPRQDHIGAIYQATNWIYVGRSSSNKQYYFRGKWRNDSPLMRYLKQHPNKKAKMKTRKVEGKHKYLLALDKKIRKQIIKLSEPYPKKNNADAHKGDSGDQLEKGSANLTRPLHLK